MFIYAVYFSWRIWIVRLWIEMIQSDKKWPQPRRFTLWRCTYAQNLYLITQCDYFRLIVTIVGSWNNLLHMLNQVTAHCIQKCSLAYTQHMRHQIAFIHHFSCAFVCLASHFTVVVESEHIYAQIMLHFVS